jgi:hypothetical protein
MAVQGIDKLSAKLINVPEEFIWSVERNSQILSNKDFS